MGEEPKTLDGHSSYVISVALSSDDTRIFSGSVDNSVWVWDSVAWTGKELKTSKGDADYVASIAFSSDAYPFRLWLI